MGTTTDVAGQATDPEDAWLRPGESALANLVVEKSRQCLASYRENPSLVEQDANIEISNVEGGYGRKQLTELVQNATDALTGSSGRVALILTAENLYCANEGISLSAAGIDALMHSHLSIKRDEQIGRFGLGFKSVLGISDRPSIFSRSVSIGFDRQRSRSQIAEINPRASRTAVLRLAEVLHPSVEARLDAVLGDLMSWASTVVRLPLRYDVEWLPDQLREFPAEFLLFAPQVSQLDLRMPGWKRSWTAEHRGHSVTLVPDEGEPQVWRGFSADHVPSAAALRDAGQISGRGRTTVAWMVPALNRTKLGRFWAHFPTKSMTSLSGLVNAPFKTNEDRHDLLEGVYNSEMLIQVLPRLVAHHLPELVNPADPGTVLDLMPGRGRESRSWADDVINEPVTALVATFPCLPDLDGILQKPAQIQIPPEAVTERPSWLEMWVSADGRPAGWLHPSVLRLTDRRAKALRLKGAAGGKPASIGEWLLDLAKAGTVECARTAVILAAEIDRREPSQMKAVRSATLVLAADGDLRRPSPGEIFLPDSEADTGSEFVHFDLASDPQTRQALVDLGIGALDPLGKLSRQVNVVTRQRRGAEVALMWQLSRSAPPKEASNIFERAFGVGGTPVRNLAQRPVPISDVLFPGAIVPADGSRDAPHVIDLEFHQDDRELLTLLGVAAVPTIETPDPTQKSYKEWWAAAVSAYTQEARAKGKAIKEDQIRAVPGSRGARWLDLLPHLSAESKVAFTEDLLRSRLTEWFITSTTNAIPPVQFTNPTSWWLRKHGAIRTSYGPMSPDNVFTESLSTPADLLPAVAPASAAAKLVGLRPAPDKADWRWILPTAEPRLPLGKLQQLYGLAASAGAKIPQHVSVEGAVRTMRVPPQDCVVTSSTSDYDALLALGRSVILARSVQDAVALVMHWEMTDGSNLVRREILHAASGETRPLVDKFPGLRTMGLDFEESVELIPCSDLTVIVDADEEDGEERLTLDGEELVFESGKIYFNDSLNDAALLTLVGKVMRWDLDDSSRQQVLDINERAGRNNVRLRARTATTTSDKLLALAGADAVRRLVHSKAIRMAERRARRPLTDREVVDMAVRSYGAAEVLKKLAPRIEANGVMTPSRLVGEGPARAWVRDLGLPEEFAGRREDRPPARQEITGPTPLSELHNYQRKAVDQVIRLLGGDGLRRGLISLPTGSGKTRVAVQGVIEHLSNSSKTPLIIWIAQSDELCEQAAETWAYLWRAMGVPAGLLTLSRFWGSNELVPLDSGTHLVVASDDQLASAQKKGGYEWLCDADIVIVDEAHTSVSPTYTSLFRWLKRGADDRSRPLIGLSATPYRGTNEAQTRLLVGRYDRNLLTDGIFGDIDEHAYLQSEEILARVKHVELEGMRLKSKSAGVRRQEDRRELAEYSIDLDAVASDDARNHRILDSILQLPPAMTVLLFAASVEHAEILAQVLNQQGVSAASVSSFTPPGERRALVSRLRSGAVRVITNYNVLSQGFDAPKVGAVYVTRPTFSLNRYQQMIGRGLRGPKNGGSKEVLIVNVRDNIDAFGEQLAFHHFDALWKGKL